MVHGRWRAEHGFFRFANAFRHAQTQLRAVLSFYHYFAGCIIIHPQLSMYILVSVYSFSGLCVCAHSLTDGCILRTLQRCVRVPILQLGDEFNNLMGKRKG